MSICLMLATGCATQASIKYMPRQGVAKVRGADKVAVSVKLTDDRADKSKISIMKNGYGVEMYPITSQNNVAELVSKAFRGELQSRGFKMNGGSVAVKIQLTKFYNDFKIGFITSKAVAEVACVVQVKKADGSINYVKAITGMYTKKGIWWLSAKNAGLALEEALKNAVSKLMQDREFISAILQADSA